MLTKHPRKHVCSPIGRLPDGWQLVRLKEVVEKVKSGSTPRGGESSYPPQRTRFALIRSQNVFDRYFNEEGLAFISDEQAAELAGAEVQADDVLLNITGDGVTFARSSLLPQHILPACVNQHVMLIRTNQDKCDPGYLLSYLTHPSIKDYIESFNAGGSRRAITKGHIESFEIPFPPLPEQRAIAHILGTLDDKIELNRRMNETLEAVARALFKSWFVDFDPARARAEGRDPVLPKPLAEVIPDSFEDSELGEIPTGWDVAAFASSVEILGGGTPKTSVPEYWGGEIPWFAVVDAPHDSDVFVLDTEKKITQAGVDNSSARILPIGTTIVSARGTVGKVALVGVEMAMNQSCYGLRGKAGTRGFFTYYSTQALLSVFQQRAHGSVFDTITRDTLAGVPVVVPPVSVVEAFEQAAAPFLERIRSNLFESRTLASIRDALLPKLLSGEIRIQDNKKLQEALA